MFRYRIKRFLLILGVVFGFGSGFASLAWHAHHGGCHGGGGPAAWHQDGPDAYREQLKAEFAQACVVAARNAQAPAPAVAPVAAQAPVAPTFIPMPFAVPYPQYAPAPQVAPVAPPVAAAPAAPSGT